MLRCLMVLVSLLLAIDEVVGAQQQPSPSGLNLMSTNLLGDGLQPGFYSYYHLLKNPAIVKELELTGEQKTKLKQVDEKHEVDRKITLNEDLEKNAKPESQSNDGIPKVNAASKEKLTRLVLEYDELVVRKILDRRQAIRLKEIQNQAEGWRFFTRPENQEILGLEPDQLIDIDRINSTATKEMRAAVMLSPKIARPPSGNEESPETKMFEGAVESARKRAAGIRVSSMKEIEQILTKAQRVKYRKMVGEPFSFYKPKQEKPDQTLEGKSTNSENKKN